ARDTLGNHGYPMGSVHLQDVPAAGERHGLSLAGQLTRQANTQPGKQLKVTIEPLRCEPLLKTCAAQGRFGQTTLVAFPSRTPPIRRGPSRGPAPPHHRPCRSTADLHPFSAAGAISIAHFHDVSVQLEPSLFLFLCLCLCLFLCPYPSRWHCHCL